MALQVWLPLNGTLENKGLSNVTVTNNGATVDNNGKIGKCYSYTASQYIELNNLPFSSLSSCSISFWLKVTVKGSSGWLPFAGLTTSYWIMATTSGTGAFYHGNTGSGQKIYKDGVLSTTPGALNEWHHYVITGVNLSSWTKFYINKYGNGWNFAGSINDVRIYNHCLSPKEVKEISKGLILHYKLDGNDIGITIPRNGGLIPDGVELYDYILSNGTQYIDTGVIVNDSTTLVGSSVDFQVVLIGSNNSATIGGAVLTSGSNAYKNAQILVYNNAFYMSSSFTFSLNTVLNRTVATYDGSTPGNPNISFLLFARHLVGATPSELMLGSIKIFKATFYENNILKRNLLPCTYLGEPGMWDTVENKFYRNQGTGLFTLGNKITLKEYEYLEANKAPYIDTQFIPKGNTSVEMQLMALSSTQNNGFFGAYGSGWADNSYGFYGWSEEKIWNNYKNDVTVGTYTSIFPINTIHKVFKDKNTLYINNRLIRQDAYTNFTAPHTLLIFDINKSNNRCPAKMRLYYTKVWDNNTLVRDYVPVSYNGTPGLWDKVEWKFYANAGSGSFTLGPEKTVQQDAPIFYDSSGYCNHGSITGTLTTNSDSPRYTKSTQIVSGATISHPLCIKEPEWTCSCWIYPTNLSSYTYLNNLAMGMKITHGTQSLLYINENPPYYRYSHTFELNKWQHIVFVFKHSTRYMAIYKDGVKDIATGPSGGTVPRLSNTITLFTGFTGYVSDYREYCTALSEDDVKELYNTSAFVTNNGVFAEYELYEDNLSDVKKRGLLETANFYENGAESGYALDTDKTRVASNYIISEDFIEI